METIRIFISFRVSSASAKICASRLVNNERKRPKPTYIQAYAAAPESKKCCHPLSPLEQSVQIQLTDLYLFGADFGCCDTAIFLRDGKVAPKFSTTTARIGVCRRAVNFDLLLNCFSQRIVEQ